MPVHPSPFCSPTMPISQNHTTPDERIALIRLARTNGIGPINFTRFLGLYGTAERALKALPERLRRTGRPLTETPSQTEIEDEIAHLERQGTRHLLRSDPDYPLLLSHIPDAPPLLFVQGNTEHLSLPSIGIVGSRNASTAGLRLAESLSTELAASGLCVISGLARGIDTAAHHGALSHRMTVAALAGSIDQPYPPENARLQAEIAESGCVITEAPPGTVPQARHFPRRNRLIAGISLGSVIIEAAARSGTLITARLAASYDRIVFAVPGSPLDLRSHGGNQLLREGAILVEHAQDILFALPKTLPPCQPPPWMREGNDPLPLFQRGISSNLSRKPEETGTEEWLISDTDFFATDATDPPVPSPKPEESPPSNAIPHSPGTDENAREKLLSLLSVTPMAVDDMVSRCQLSVQTVMRVLGELELDGVIESLPGGQVALLPGAIK